MHLKFSLYLGISVLCYKYMVLIVSLKIHINRVIYVDSLLVPLGLTFGEFDFIISFIFILLG